MVYFPFKKGESFLKKEQNHESVEYPFKILLLGISHNTFQNKCIYQYKKSIYICVDRTI